MTKPQIRKLAEVEAIQLGLFDELNLVEFESEDYPEERLIACRNPLIAEKNQKQRETIQNFCECILSTVLLGLSINPVMKRLTISNPFLRLNSSLYCSRYSAIDFGTPPKGIIAQIDF